LNVARVKQALAGFSPPLSPNDIDTIAQRIVEISTLELATKDRIIKGLRTRIRNLKEKTKKTTKTEKPKNPEKSRVKRMLKL